MMMRWQFTGLSAGADMADGFVTCMSHNLLKQQSPLIRTIDMSVCYRGHQNIGRDATRHCIQCRRENQLRAYYRKKGVDHKVSPPALFQIKSERRKLS